MAAPPRRRLRPYQRAGLWASRVAVWAILLVVFFPLWSIVVASFQPGGAFSSSKLVPDRIVLDNYREVLSCPSAGRCYPLWLKNTVLIGLIVGTVQVLMIAASAFAFSRLRFWGRRYGIAALWLVQTFPAFMFIPAVYNILVRLKLDNTFWGLVIIHMGASAYNIWLMKGYMDGIPRELDEAAMADGATTWQVFTRIILPLSRPMLAVMFLFNFMGPFNEFLMSSLINKDPRLYTVPVGLQRFVTNQWSTRWGPFAAAFLITAVPMAAIWGLGQRWIQSGLTRGAVKG